MADVQVDANLFRQRVRHLWHRWQTDAKLLDKKSIVIYVNDPSDTTLTYSVVLQRWLFNYEFRSTIFVITDKEFICLTSQKKVNFLAPLLGSSDDDNQSPKVVLLARNRHNESENYKILMNAISQSRQGNQIGTFFKDLPVGSFIEEFDSQIATTYRKEGIDSILSQVMLVKDQSEIQSMDCVAKVISFLYKQTKDQIYEWIESMKKGKDSELCEFLKKLTASEKFQQIPKSDYFEFCIDPKIISGGKNMELDYSSTSSNRRTLLNSIVCYFQGRIDFYCCTMARTILINPTKSKEDNYKFAVDFHNHVISLAEPKKQLGDIYRKAIAFVEERRPDLLENITHCFGTSSGIHPNNKLVQIVANSEIILPQSFTLQISVTFKDLCAEDESNNNMKYYSILLVDTIAYKDGNMSLVTKNSKQIEYISISHNDPNEDGESDNSEYLDNYLNQANVDINSRRILRKPAIFKDKAQLLNHQRELKQELYLKANDKLRSLNTKSDEAK
ncbi:MAG: FACT complex subunit SPT16, partial [Marteilia pararefringens]